MDSKCHPGDVSLLDRTRRALEEIRPHLKADGGDVELIGIDNNVVTVRFTGHCSSCPLSSQTLKAGIEKHLRQRLPEIVAVEQDKSVSVPVVDGLKLSQPFTTQHSHDATAALREDHDRIRLNLKQLETALQAVSATWPAVNQDQMDTIRRAHSSLATTCLEHMKFEEEILFPAVLPFVNWGSPTAALEKEHRDLRLAIEAMDKAILNLDFSGPENLFGVTGQLCRKMREHLFREENTVFFEADAVLDKPMVWLLNQQRKRSCAALALS